MKTMTIRSVPPELAAALEAEKRRRGLSLNRTVLSLMQESTGRLEPSAAEQRAAPPVRLVERGRIPALRDERRRVRRDRSGSLEMTAASHAGAVVLTFDEHFRRIDRVGACVL